MYGELNVIHRCAKVRCRASPLTKCLKYCHLWQGGRETVIKKSSKRLTGLNSGLCRTSPVQS